MAPGDTAFASFQDKWLQANPEQLVVAAFLPPGQRQRAAAFGTFVHELAQAAFDASEAHVALAKLQWWRQELEMALAGSARHPVSRELFEQSMPATDPGLWTALVDGAAMQIDPPPASSLRDSMAVLGDFYRPVAALEQALAGGKPASTRVDATLWICTHLLRRASERDQAHALPLDLLARHGLTRADLEQATAPRAAALRDWLGQLGDAIAGGLDPAAGASLGRRVRARLDLDLASRARRSADPLEVLARRPAIGRWRSVWIAWSEARALARRGTVAGSPGT
jgi:phytoene synthase